ncbi:hypothetical protein HHI36_011206 [Cryptolaemus montrouzieri]|uniref:Uncharacterized protein n=1 Tax=Cryptolaemus montrouzieri TaxID=559131 RepID=A0ABD2ML51_9CUCU
MQDDILCIIPSSGTTGKRKLIKIESYCIQQNVDSLNKVFNLNEKDVIYFGSPLTFDPSLVELLLALKVGASLIVVPEKSKLNHETLYRTLFPKTSEYPGPTFLQIVPSLFTRWSEKQKKYILNESKLKILAFGGEPFPLDILQFPRSLKLYNLYGITEVSCWATIHEIKGDKVFLGYPLEETFLKIYDKEKVIEEGIGELYIGSNTRFCYVDKENQKVAWRPTGDLVNKTVDGIKYLGRKNSWVKRFGNRICLNQIKNKIYENIKLSSEVIWFETVSKLLLFILIPSIYQEDRMRVLDKIRLTLLRVLSKEEFPDFFDIISTFPVTCNGKIDKNTLIEIYKQNETTLTNTRACDVFSSFLADILVIEIKQKRRRIEEIEENISEEIEIVWKYNLLGCVDASPLLFEENGNLFVAVGSFSGYFGVFNALSGEPIFMKQFPDSIGNKAIVCPSLNFLYFGCFDGNLYCINLDKKIIEWTYHTDNSIKCKPSFCEGKEALVFGSYDKNLHCISSKSGGVIWRTNIRESIVASPILHHSSNQILVTTLVGSCISVSEKTGAINWCIKLKIQYLEHRVYLMKMN